MIAAIYARKSTEQNGVADEQKSVARQIEHARQYAARKGWIVDDDRDLVDDGISGAEFANRPGFLRLMNALKPRAPFQVLVMSEESRLGREAIETAYALKQLVQAGVRVFFYLEDRERTLDSPTDKIMLSLTAFADELEREKARQRTYDAMQRKAKAGHVTGGASSATTTSRSPARTASGRTSSGEINEPKPPSSGGSSSCARPATGLTRITKALNEDRVPRRGRNRGVPWAGPAAPCAMSSCVRSTAARSLEPDPEARRLGPGEPADARGRRMAARSGARAPDRLGGPLARRAGAIHGAAGRSTRRRAAGARTSSPPYLLSGFARCGTCGGSLSSSRDSMAGSG